MKTIWKYPIPITDEFTLDLPIGAEVLSVNLQYKKSYIWVFIPNTNSETTKRNFRLFGTGNPVDIEGYEYIGMLMQWPFVWHLFEEIK